MKGEFASGQMWLGDDGELMGPWYGSGGEEAPQISFGEFSKLKKGRDVLIRDVLRDFARDIFGRISNDPMGFVLKIPGEEIEVAVEVAMNALLRDLPISLNKSQVVNLRMINSVRKTMGWEELSLLEIGRGYVYDYE